MSDYEREDAELAAMMGDKFIDQTVPLAEKPKSEQQTTDFTELRKVVREAIDSGDIQPTPYPTKQRNWMDDLKDCTKSTLIFGGLNVLIWYWEIAGLMDESIALPSMLACAALAGLGIGKAIGGKR
jgi:hypothetical protein